MVIGNLSEFTGNARVDEQCFGILNIFCQYQVWQTIANGTTSKVIEKKEFNLRAEADGNFFGIYGQCTSGWAMSNAWLWISHNCHSLISHSVMLLNPQLVSEKGLLKWFTGKAQVDEQSLMPSWISPNCHSIIHKSCCRSVQSSELVLEEGLLK